MFTVFFYPITQYCHLCLIIAIGIPIFLTDQILILISLETIVSIQLLWVIYDHCILNYNLNRNNMDGRSLDFDIDIGFGQYFCHVNLGEVLNCKL